MFKFKLCKVSEMPDQLDLIFNDMIAEIQWETYRKELEEYNE